MSPHLLKKHSLDRNRHKIYRPVSNLSFISKLIKEAEAKQLNINVNQSAYRRLHTTETALLKIQNDIAASMDSGKASVLTLLDLLAAFNIVDHNIILLLFRCLLTSLWCSPGFCPGAPPFYPLHHPSVIFSMSPTLCMLMTPKYI